MKKISKFLSIILIFTIFLSVSVSNYPVNAQTTTFNEQIKVTANKENAEVTEAIKLIEQKYLKQELDGTTTIDPEADKYIDLNLLKQLRAGSAQINAQIKNGNLIFEQETKTLKEKHDVKPCTDIYGDYLWHWYGFDFFMDAYNSNLMGIKLTQYAYLLAGGAAAGYFIPGLTFVCGVGAATIGYWGSIAIEGGANGRGSIAFFFGDPSWAQLYSVQLR